MEKLRHEKPEVFTELVVSNITRLIDLPGTELAQLMGEVDLKLPGGASPAPGFFRSLMSLKRKGRGVSVTGGQVSAAPCAFLLTSVHSLSCCYLNYFLVIFLIFVSSKILSNSSKNF